MKLNWKEGVVFLGFIALATILWYIHAMTSVRTENVEVQVRYTGISTTIAFKDTLPSSITVEVRDAGQRLKTYFKEQPAITLNLAPQLDTPTGEVIVSEEKLRSSVTSILQGTSKLLAISPSTIRTSYYHLAQKVVPVRLITDVQPASEYQIVGQPTLEVNQVTLVGKPSDLDSILEVTAFLAQTGIKDTVITAVPLAIPASVRATEDSVNVRTIAERFTEKVFRLPIQAVNLPEGTNVRFFPSEVTVVVRCAMRHFQKVTENDLEVYCVIPDKMLNHLPVHVKKHDKAISSMRVSPSQVEYLLEQQ